MPLVGDRNNAAAIKLLESFNAPTQDTARFRNSRPFLMLDKVPFYENFA
jgi:hypothetical protein